MTGPGPDHDLEELVAGAERPTPGGVDWATPAGPVTGSSGPPPEHPDRPVGKAEPGRLGGEP